MTGFKVQLDELAAMHASILDLAYRLDDEPLRADLTAQAAGSHRVESDYAEFVHVWSDARAKISTNLDQLGGAVLAALAAYKTVEREIREAATPAPASSSTSADRSRVA